MNVAPLPRFEADAKQFLEDLSALFFLLPFFFSLPVGETQGLTTGSQGGHVWVACPRLDPFSLSQAGQEPV